MKTMKRRALVLSHEAARHPFRRSLPAHVFAIPAPAELDAEQNAKAARDWKMTGSDWRGFLAAYTASFVAIAIFIA